MIKRTAMKEFLDLLIYRMPENDRLELLNIYRETKGKTPVLLNCRKELVNYFDNDLENFLLAISNADGDYTMADKYFYKDDDKFALHSMNEYDGDFGTDSDRLDKDEMLEFMIDHWEDFENYFEEDIFDETHYDETELEEE